MRRAYALVILPAVAGAALGAVAYLAPVSGVTGTTGALLALVGAVLVAAGGALALSPAVRGRRFALLTALVGLGALLTAVAAWFLMQNAFAVAMGLAFLGLLAALVLSPRRMAR